jgi:hypothetical protein
MQRLRELSKLGPGWDDYGAASPNGQAMLNAEDILNRLYDANLSPSRMAPSVEEGIALSFSRADRYAVIECSNEGSIVVGLSFKGSDPKVWEIMSDSDIDDAIERIYEYLNG